MCISTFIHLGLVEDLVLLGQINAGIFFGRRTSASYENFGRAQSDGCRALVEFVTGVVRELFDCPFVFIYIVAETDL